MQSSVCIKQQSYLREQKNNALEPFFVVISRGTCKREDTGPFELKRHTTRRKMGKLRMSHREEENIEAVDSSRNTMTKTLTQWARGL
jgi:hypothetical protein